MSNHWETTPLGRAYMSLRAPVLRTADRFGLRVAKRSPATDDMMALSTMLKNRDVDLILDVGANTGQFAEKVFGGGGGTLDALSPSSRSPVHTRS